jgi:hypothetical protein
VHIEDYSNGEVKVTVLKDTTGLSGGSNWSESSEKRILQFIPGISNNIIKMTL